jgi:hypothetical protein
MNTRALGNARAQLFGAWSAIGYMVTILLGWWTVAGFVPPISPGASAHDVAMVFQNDYTRIRIGMIMVMFSALIFIPFAAAMCREMSRIEGGPGVLTFTCALGGVGNMVLSFYPAVWWLAGVFRPERAPDLMQLVNDLSWLQFIGGLSMYLAMPLSLVGALFLFGDTKGFPRWSIYLSAWTVLLEIPGQLLFFFHSGPFAWNGLLGLYVPLAAFTIWFVTMFFVMRKSAIEELAAARGIAPAAIHGAKPA